MTGKPCWTLVNHGSRTKRKDACENDSKNSSKEFENVTKNWSRRDVRLKKLINQLAQENISSIMGKCANQWGLISPVSDFYNDFPQKP